VPFRFIVERQDSRIGHIIGEHVGISQPIYLLCAFLLLSLLSDLPYPCLGGSCTESMNRNDAVEPLAKFQSVSLSLSWSYSILGLTPSQSTTRPSRPISKSLIVSIPRPRQVVRRPLCVVVTSTYGNTCKDHLLGHRSKRLHIHT
jgi:hypothetical protein